MFGEPLSHFTRAGALRGLHRLDLLLVGFVGGTGGASALMRDLAAGFRTLGLATGIVLPAWDTNAPFAGSCAEQGIPVACTRLLNGEGGGVGRGVAALRFVGGFRAPMLHYHLSENYVDGSFVRALEMLPGPRVYVTPHSPYDEPPADAPPVRRWAEAAPRIARRVICVSEHGRERQVRYGVPSKLTAVVYNGVDTARFAAGDARVARETLGLPAGARLIVSTARVEQQKRPLDAVAAFVRVAGEFPDAHLVLVGRGPLEGETRAAADRAGVGDRVHLVGHQFNVPDWLAASTVWLLPTVGEASTALGVVEALAAGCAVVSTHCRGNDEILVDGENALLAPVGDVASLAAGLRRALSDPGLRARLGTAARIAAQGNSIARVVEGYLACYEEGEREASAAGAASGPRQTLRHTLRQAHAGARVGPGTARLPVGSDVG